MNSEYTDIAYLIILDTKDYDHTEYTYIGYLIFLFILLIYLIT